MFLVNSRNPHFTATPVSFRSEFLHQQRHTFSRSYGVNLPSSLARVLSRALGYSPCPPESVSGTVTKVAPHAAFLGSMGSPSFWPQLATSSPLEVKTLRLSLPGPRMSLYRLEPALPFAGWAYPSPSLLGSKLPRWCRNINLLPIAYAFRPRLRGRLTLGRMILALETLDLRRGGFSPPLSLLMPA